MGMERGKGEGMEKNLEMEGKVEMAEMVKMGGNGGMEEMELATALIRLEEISILSRQREILKEEAELGIPAGHMKGITATPPTPHTDTPTTVIGVTVRIGLYQEEAPTAFLKIRTIESPPKDPTVTVLLMFMIESHHWR